MESQDSKTQAVSCSGSLSLDLPPGVGVVGGRRTLSADVDYVVQQAADGSGPVVMLRNADAIIAPLATIARASEPTTETPLDAVDENDAAPEADELAPLPAEPVTPAQPARPAGTRPSFDCAQCPHEGGDCGVRRCRAGRARSQHGRAVQPLDGGGDRPTSRRCCAARATASSATATAARPMPASAMPIPGGCARFATSWKAAGSRDNRG